MWEQEIEKRIRNEALKSKVMTPEEAAMFVEKGMTVGMGGFTAVGYPKAFPLALAARGEALAKKSEANSSNVAGDNTVTEGNLDITLITGASVGDEMDGALARSGVVKRRYPYQTNKDMRNAINQGKINYVDMHLSQVPLWMRQGIFGPIHLAVVEAAAITEEGNIIPTASIGHADTLVACAEKVIVEISTRIPTEIEGLHDIYTPEKVPNTQPIPLTKPGDRIGTTYIPCDPNKIAGIIFSDIIDGNGELQPADETMSAIAEHLIDFLAEEVKAGRLTNPLPPLQSGVGGVANAVLSCLEESDFTDLTVYTEVMQDAVLRLIEKGKVKMASGTALTISPSGKERVWSDINSIKDKVVIRPEEISNSPEIIRRLGLIAMNTAIEVDLGGNVNSTHIGGTRLMNGIGGSGDFARNAGLTIFTTASTAKNGEVSSIVPMVSHIDHTEHDVDVIITEIGAADLRGLTAFERAEVLIKNCAHPKFRDELRAFVNKAEEREPKGHGLAAYGGTK